MAKFNNGGLVYSTESGRVCPGCEMPVDECCCSDEQGVPGGDGVVRVRRETKARRGKTVTVITGVPLDSTGVKKVCKELKQKCSSGGTVKDNVIELQGDHKDKVIELLKQKGWQVKAAGG